MPTSICTRAKCQRLSIWPAGTRHDSPAPEGARQSDWRCWRCGGRLRQRRDGEPSKGEPTAAAVRQLTLALGLPIPIGPPAERPERKSQKRSKTTALPRVTTLGGGGHASIEASPAADSALTEPVPSCSSYAHEAPMKPVKLPEMTRMSMWVPRELLQALSRRVEQLRRQSPGLRCSRSDLIRWAAYRECGLEPDGQPAGAAAGAS